MALIKCKECNGQVSASAKACPTCGAPPPKQTSIGSWVVAGIAMLTVATCIFTPSEADKKAKAEVERVARLTPAQKEADTAAKRAAKEREDKDEAAFQVAQRAAHTIRQSANDPKSIEWTSLAYADNGAILIEFRGRNAFNALIKNMAVVTPDGKVAAGADTDKLVIALHNKYIAGQSLHRLPKPPQ